MNGIYKMKKIYDTKKCPSGCSSPMMVSIGIDNSIVYQCPSCSHIVNFGKMGNTGDPEMFDKLGI